ncbi:Low-density lipoprotein receptor- protein 1B [Desmophyllum pertusum]|uniref:Low-density lipoprotein receptor- protein 1B n=1 Tax=Desmophyllum pertusum TaxID=174260 RepID=A0A9X0CJU6_9CNID|nr:Low-density lipoprotein receptor- protein 1B [Desmophyllum pertusum]
MDGGAYHNMRVFYVLSLLIFAYTQVHGTSYAIKVTTSPRLFSGTDARVSVNLIGANDDSTGSIRLHNSIWDFETGRTDTFHRDAKFVGHLKAVKITVSFSGSPLYTFYFNKWIPAWRWTTAYEQNECRAGIALCQHVCVDTKSNYNCACHKGYELDGRYKCQDLNECVTGRHECEPQSTSCSNNLGSYTCQCKNGYQPNQSLYKCQDVNECNTGNHKCDNQTTTCSNVLGSYTCLCKDGYQPDQSLYKCHGKLTCCLNG